MEVPADIMGLWKKKMTGKANNENLFTERSHLWICGCQCHDTKSKIRLIRFLTTRDHMEEKKEFVEVG